jgi:HD-GYP domain-containing protein (c-di-GMP phosphodiesterase class II)
LSQPSAPTPRQPGPEIRPPASPQECHATPDPTARIEELNRIGIALSAETNLRRLLGLIVQKARQFTAADAGSLYLVSNGELHFEVAQNDTLARRHGREDAFKPFRLKLDDRSIAGYVALTGEVLNLPDAYRLRRKGLRFNRDFDVRNDYRTRSMLVVPMRDHEGQVIGVLQLINAQGPDTATHGEIIAFPQECVPLVLSLASQAAVAIRNAKLLADIKGIFAALIRYSASAIDARSPHTAGHSRRVAFYACGLAQAVSDAREGPLASVHFSEERLEALNYAAWLHDIGKIGVRENVLEKRNRLNDDRLELVRTRFRLAGLTNPEQAEELAAGLALVEEANAAGFLKDEVAAALGRLAEESFALGGERQPLLTPFEVENLSVRKGNLTAAEYREIQSHVHHTLDILEKIPFTRGLANIPRFAACHHEMLDGSGYPAGLRGDEVPLEARILAVVDIFDALTARDRPYKKAIPVERALSILIEEARLNRLDAGLVELFAARVLSGDMAVETTGQG